MQAVVGKRQLLALEPKLALRRLERAGHVEPAVDLTAQLWPQLGQACEFDIDLPGQALLQAAAALDAVVAQAQVEVGEGPLLAGAVGLGRQHGGLPAQAALEVKVGVEFELFVLEFALAAQRSGQSAGQLRHPVRRVQRRQVQRGVPRNAVGELQVQVTFGLALTGAQFQLRQEHLRKVAAERRDHRERAGRAIEVGREVTEVVAVFIGNLAVEGTQRHLGLVDQRVQAMPREIQPGDFGIGAEALLPVQVGAEFQALFVAGIHVQAGDLRAFGVYLALQQQIHRAFFRRQHGLALQLVATAQVALGGKVQLIELQGVGQISTGLEAIGGDAQLGGQVFRQRLQFAAEFGRQVAAAVGVEFEGLEQVAVDLQRHRPRRAAGCIRQAQIAAGGQRPIAAGLQQAAQVQHQVVAPQVHGVDLHPRRGPVRRQLQALEFLAAVEQQTTDTDVAQLQGHRQFQVRQLNRSAALVATGGKLQADLLHIQLIDAQGHAQQTGRRPR